MLPFDDVVVDGVPCSGNDYVSVPGEFKEKKKLFPEQKLVGEELFEKIRIPQKRKLVWIFESSKN